MPHLEVLGVTTRLCRCAHLKGGADKEVYDVAFELGAAGWTRIHVRDALADGLVAVQIGELPEQDVDECPKLCHN